MALFPQHNDAKASQVKPVTWKDAHGSCIRSNTWLSAYKRRARENVSIPLSPPTTITVSHRLPHQVTGMNASDYEFLYRTDYEIVRGSGGTRRIDEFCTLRNINSDLDPSYTLTVFDKLDEEKDDVYVAGGTASEASDTELSRQTRSAQRDIQAIQKATTTRKDRTFQFEHHSLCPNVKDIRKVPVDMDSIKPTKPIKSYRTFFLLLYYLRLN